MICLRTSRDQAMNHAAAEIGQAVIATVVATGKLRVVNSELMENCCVDVAHVDGVFNRLPSKFVGCAVGESALEAASGNPHRKAVRVVVAAIVRASSDKAASGLKHGRAAELRAGDNDGFVEEAA